MPGRITHIVLLVLLTLLLLAATSHAKVGKSAIQSPEKVGTTETAGTRTVADAYSAKAEREVLRELLERAQTRVRELSEQARALPAGEARRSLQQEIARIKQETRLEFLHTKADFARRRGELETAAAIDLVIEKLQKPRFTVPVSSKAKGADTTEKGGPR
jgi:hypothetical protein